MFQPQLAGSALRSPEQLAARPAAIGNYVITCTVGGIVFQIMLAQRPEKRGSEIAPAVPQFQPAAFRQAPARFEAGVAIDVYLTLGVESLRNSQHSIC